MTETQDDPVSVTSATRHRAACPSARACQSAAPVRLSPPLHPIAGPRRAIRHQSTLPGHVIDDVEDTKAAAAHELVVDEIERPAGIRLGLNQDRSTSSHRLAATSAFAHGQALLAIEPVDAIDAGWLALVPQ